MSQADFTSADAAQVAAIFQDMLLANFCGVAATTLLFYDYVLMFSREFYYTKVAFVVAPPPLVGCADLVNMTSSASETRKQLKRTVLLRGVPSDVYYAQSAYSTTLEIKRSFAAIGTRAKDSLETLVQSRELSYVSLIQRDGTIYFLALLILNVVDLVAIKNQVISLPTTLPLITYLTPSKTFGSLPALTEVLTSILISRFLLDLRSVYLSSRGMDSNKEGSSTDSHLSSILFARHSVAGNLGAPLEAMVYNPEESYEQVAAEEIAYVAADPLAMGLHSSPGDDHDYHDDCDTDLRPLKE
ncbi:uncharacterized protein B0H18DRAFT_1124507 [Fomitopsis serialis]|uniref:uncharacterized protein n=1 Tax=Fomitopsis serialis TaxID=139415 RepID=UPI00200732AA|nr:uncharacterized protein B0H18DRAFT_1124507 [Neoantrodia serialis]KAH9916042.1 hypothetical protein B0H18DRAFT_1124507 [Neoantrodia serialis]